MYSCLCVPLPLERHSDLLLCSYNDRTLSIRLRSRPEALFHLKGYPVTLTFFQNAKVNTQTATQIPPYIFKLSVPKPKSLPQPHQLLRLPRTLTVHRLDILVNPPHGILIRRTPTFPYIRTIAEVHIRTATTVTATADHDDLRSIRPHVIAGPNRRRRR